MEEENKTYLEQKFLHLPLGSYFVWIERDWFEKFKPHLGYRDNKWLPKLSHVAELNTLCAEYDEYLGKILAKEKHEKENSEALKSLTT